MSSDEPDYSRYTYDELQDALRHINKDLYPDRVDQIAAELERRGAGSAPVESSEHPRVSQNSAVVAPGEPANKKDVWPVVVGICAIVFGFLGLLGSAQRIFLAWMIPKQAELMSTFARTMPTDTPEQGEAMAEFATSFWNVPSWFNLVNTPLAIVSVVICVVYAYAGFLLVQRRRSGCTWLIRACYVSILIHIANGITSILALSLWSFSTLPGTLVGLIVDGVLIFVVRGADKELLISDQPMAT